MGITVYEYLNKTNKHFFKYGIMVKYHSLIGKIFKSTKHLDKALYYLDRRWDIMMALCRTQK